MFSNPSKLLIVLFIGLVSVEELLIKSTHTSQYLSNLIRGGPTANEPISSPLV